jgi:nucleoside-diphosphate-sugar epimerase
MNSKSLIVGATGSLGPSVVKALKEKDQQIRILVRDKSKAEKYFGKNSGIEIVLGSASNEETIAGALDGCSHLFYLVNTPYHKCSESSEPLLTSSINAALRKNAKIVFPGNVYNYGYTQYNPVDEKHPWNAHTKKGKIRINLEEMLKKAKTENGLKYTIIRMPDFYGPYVINTFSEKAYINALMGKTIRWIGNLDTKTEYIFIEDGGKAMVIAGLSDKSTGEEYNVPAFSPITSREYLNEIVNQAGQGSKITTLNSDLIFSIGGLFSPMIKEVKEMLYLKREELILDGTKFKETFGNIPARNYKDGVAATLDWVKEFYSL